MNSAEKLRVRFTFLNTVLKASQCLCVCQTRSHSVYVNLSASTGACFVNSLWKQIDTWEYIWNGNAENFSFLCNWGVIMSLKKTAL